MNALVRRFAFLFLAFAALAVSPAHAQRERLPPEDADIVNERWPNAKKTFTGLRYIVLKEGEKDGKMPEPGTRVAVLYKGMLLDGKVFDQKLDPADPLRVRIGRGELIAGWDQALQMMTKGSKWLVILPYEIAYGTRGRPPSIPRRATLVFEMELLDFGPLVPAP